MIAIEHTDAVNSKILAVSEDRIQGFVREPFSEIARLSGVEETVVLDRIKAMLMAGTIRRVRQTLLSTNLAEGALVAWKVPDDKLDGAFGFMFRQDPFSGHVVVRSTDSQTAGSEYKLWTTIKVPQGFGLDRHTNILLKKVGGERVRIMPAKGIFTLGVGHVRRKTVEPGSRADRPAGMIRTEVVKLNDLEWRVLTALKREFTTEEIVSSPWRSRAKEADLPLDLFFSVAEDLESAKNHRKVFNVPGTCETFDRGYPGDPIQWAVSLGCAARYGNPGRLRSRPARDLDALLLARGRTGIRQCEYHGSCPRNRETATS